MTEAPEASMGAAAGDRLGEGATLRLRGSSELRTYTGADLRNQTFSP